MISYIRSNNLTGSKTNKVIIVFDGRSLPELHAQERHFQVIFSDQITADEIIIDKVRHLPNKSEILVVSNDRSLAAAIKNFGAKNITIADFIKKNKSRKVSQKQTHADKDISYVLQREITEEMRKIWLKDKE